jgi:CheY-like chemotaxis protein
VRRVLVVEDDPVLAMATEDTLRDGGVEHVVICPTTESALEALREERPDALVLDVHLADRDDGWAIAELVETLGDASPRIVFATGAPQDIPPRIAELGSVLTKPYAPAALLDALREPNRRGLLSRLRGALS